ncbi:MAG: right-handed parallel beta-helix repeat-containing protein [Rickettsiales bacterium]|nr:right-handed parallel beta-helix repeat-containing protein [Rickettsiales bacterium]
MKMWRWIGLGIVMIGAGFFAINQRHENQLPKAMGLSEAAPKSEANVADSIRALLLQAESEGGDFYYVKAVAAAQEMSAPFEQAQALLAIVRSQLHHDKARLAVSTYTHLYQVLDVLDAHQYSSIALAMVDTLLVNKEGIPTGSANAIDKARQLTEFISHGPARVQAWGAIGRAVMAISSGEAAANDGSVESLQQGNPNSAFYRALAMPLDATELRNGKLIEVLDAALSAQDYTMAIHAVSAMQSSKSARDAQFKLFNFFTANKEWSQAERVVHTLHKPLDAAMALIDLAQAYHSLGYTLRANNAVEQVFELLPEVKGARHQADVQARIAEYFANADDEANAQKALALASTSQFKARALASLTMMYLRAEKMSLALDVFASMSNAPADLLESVSLAIANAYVTQEMPQEAMEFLSKQTLPSTAAQRPVQLAIIAALLAQKKMDEAQLYVDSIADPLLKAQAGALFASRRDYGGDKAAKYENFVQVQSAIEALPDEAQRSSGFRVLASVFADEGMFERAQFCFYQMNDEDLLQSAPHVFSSMVEKGQSEDAIIYADDFEQTAVRDASYAALARALATHQDIQSATATARKILNTSMRVSVFRDVAKIQAGLSDFYQLLGDSTPVSQDLRAVQTDAATRMILPKTLAKTTQNKQSLDDFESTTVDMIKSRQSDVLMRESPASDIAQAIPAIQAPKELQYDTAYVRSLLPPATRFRAGRIYYANSPYNLKFHFAAGNADFVRRQKSAIPDVITIEKGVVDLSTLQQEMQAQGFGEYLVKLPNKTYLLRRPIVIGPEATLVISAADTNELKLSVEAGAYIVNAGTFFAVDTRLTGWSEEHQRAAIETKAARTFRPFYVSWSRSVTNMASTELTAMGYTASKSYGLTVSSGPSQFEKAQSRDYKRPTGIIVDNSFRNFLYGFYSYEADNVVLVGNEYVDNLVYGIDPHDRSRWLMIAYNTVYDSHKKHGIIISREVNFSTLLGNVLFNNGGSGLMADRFSTGTMIYANTSFSNKGDGLTVFESSCKLIASNRLFENKRAGIRVRNSMDVGIYFNEIRGNRQAAVQGYVLDLKTSPVHAGRDFKLDPYTDVTAITMVGNWIERNGVGILGDQMAALFLRANHFLSQSPKLLRGSWEAEAPHIFSSSDVEGNGIFITNRCVKGVIAVRDHCDYRDDGFFVGDGQDRLVERVDEDYCAAPATPDEPLNVPNVSNDGAGQ